jgi:hypothetical protein
MLWNKSNVSWGILAALLTFKKENGRTWKSKLRQARNLIGPSGLDRVDL